jgi:hypothetical protein
MKKITISLIFTALVVFFTGFSAFAQIEDIKDKANENKDKNDKDDNISNNNSDSPGDGIADACFGACFEVGCNVFVGFIGEYTSHLFETKPDDPTILSLDINGNFALAFHKGIDKNYTYVNYLPGIRANLLSFILDFRYNILTEYTDDFPNSFKSWHLDLALNIVPDAAFKIGIGIGVQAEMTTDSYFHEYFLCSKIGLSGNTDYIDFDLRASVDYETEAFPFFETGVRFNKRMLDFEHLSGYISLGPIYQNYYQSHDIWGFRGGVIFNWH